MQHCHDGHLALIDDQMMCRSGVDIDAQCERFVVIVQRQFGTSFVRHQVLLPQRIVAGVTCAEHTNLCTVG